MNLSSVGKFFIHLQEAVLSAISTSITSHFRGLCVEAEYGVVFSLLPLPVVLMLAPFSYICEDPQLSRSCASVPFFIFVNSDSTSMYCIIEEGKSTCMCWCSSLSRVPFVTLWTVARQPPLSVEFSRQEHWSV